MCVHFRFQSTIPWRSGWYSSHNIRQARVVPVIADFGLTVYAFILTKHTWVLLDNYIRAIVVRAILTTKRIRFEPSPEDVPETFFPRNGLSTDLEIPTCRNLSTEERGTSYLAHTLPLSCSKWCCRFMQTQFTKSPCTTKLRIELWRFSGLVYSIIVCFTLPARMVLSSSHLCVV